MQSKRGRRSNGGRWLFLAGFAAFAALWIQSQEMSRKLVHKRASPACEVVMHRCLRLCDRLFPNATGFSVSAAEIRLPRGNGTWRPSMVVDACDVEGRYLLHVVGDGETGEIWQITPSWPVVASGYAVPIMLNAEQIRAASIRWLDALGFDPRIARWRGERPPTSRQGLWTQRYLISGRILRLALTQYGALAEVYCWPRTWDPYQRYGGNRMPE